MDAELVTSFVTITGIWLVTVITPGPNFVATVHGTVNGTRVNGLAVAGGIAIGTTLWAGASLLGLGLLFENVGWLYLTVKTVSAGYLIFIGAGMIWAARGNGATASLPRQACRGGRVAGTRCAPGC